MRPLHRLTPVAIATTLLVTACSSDSGSGAPSGPAASSSAAASAAGASAATPASASGDQTAGADEDVLAADCSSAPADLVNAVLGDSVRTPKQSKADAHTVTCSYEGAKVGHLTIRIRTGQTAAGFADGKKALAGQGTKTADLADFADDAYSGTSGSGSDQITTVAALMGSSEVVVTGRSSLDQEKALVGEVLSRAQP